MSERGRDRVALFDKAIDNSQVVRERDPRAHRELGTVLFLVALLVLGLVLYAWPHYASLRAGMAAQQLEREKERLREENRKLRLERATLENLRRVEAIASRRLGLQPPKAEQIVVVEKVPVTPLDEVHARKLTRREGDPDTRNEP